MSVVCWCYCFAPFCQSIVLLFCLHRVGLKKSAFSIQFVYQQKDNGCGAVACRSVMDMPDSTCLSGYRPVWVDSVDFPCVIGS